MIAKLTQSTAFAPEAAGSGIPHVKAVLHGLQEFRWQRVLAVKFASGVAGIGSGFALDLMVKDLGIALGIADDNELDVPLSAALVGLWRDAGELLGPGRDHTEIARWIDSTIGAGRS